MVFALPSALWLLVPVAAVALAIWLRPGRRMVPVAALRLWREAVSELEARQRPRRSISLSWLLLLAGAVAAVAAVAQPIFRNHRPRRTVAVRVVASAEVADPDGVASIRDALGRFIQRLDSHDRIQLLRPISAGSGTGLLSRTDALAAASQVGPVTAPAAALRFPPADESVQRVYRVAPAGSVAPGKGDILVTPTIPPVAIDAAAAQRLEGGSSQLMVALSNHTSGAIVVELRIEFDAVPTGLTRPVDLVAGGREVEIFDVPAGTTEIRASVGDRVGQWVRLVVRPGGDVKVATTGRANPFFGRAVRATEAATLTTDAAGADVVIASGVDVPGDRPAIVFDAPTPPRGFRHADSIGSLSLADADVLVDDPLLADVSFAGVAIRRARPFIAEPAASGRRLVTVEAGILMLATSAPKRLYVAFDPDPANTNWGLDESFPILMAAALTWMADAAGPRWTVADGVVGRC